MDNDYNSLSKPFLAGANACQRKQSECEAAYDTLHKSQGKLDAAVSELSARLQPVMNPALGNEVACAPKPSAQSEVHGWLLAAEERNYEAVRRLRAIIESLTI